MPLRSKTTKEVVLRPVHPNVGLELEFRRRLNRLVDEMHKSSVYWLTAAYRANEPEIAQDESPVKAMRAAMRRLTRRWQRNFDRAAQELADYFSKAVADRSDAALKSILKRGGFSVEFKMTRAVNDIVQATIAEQVGLIKSIPQQYLKNVEGIVMRSVQTGRDLEQLTKDLQEQHGVAKRRAVFIAQSQNNMATATVTRARQAELGIELAQWTHSGGGAHPRESHVKAGRDKVRYKISEGWFDPHEGRNILPGELPRCRCVSRSVIPGFL